MSIKTEFCDLKFFKENYKEINTPLKLPLSHRKNLFIANFNYHSDNFTFSPFPLMSITFEVTFQFSLSTKLS